MRVVVALAVGVVVSGGARRATASEPDPLNIPIELAMRELQARVELALGDTIAWPTNRKSQPAPPYPPDGFYCSARGDAEYAAELARVIIYELHDRAPYSHVNFLRIVDGDLEGDSTLYSLYPAHFLTTIADADPSETSADNVCAKLHDVRRDIGLMQHMEVEVLATPADSRAFSSCYDFHTGGSPPCTCYSDQYSGWDVPMPDYCVTSPACVGTLDAVVADFYSALGWYISHPHVLNGFDGYFIAITEQVFVNYRYDDHDSLWFGKGDYHVYYTQQVLSVDAIELPTPVRIYLRAEPLYFYDEDAWIDADAQGGAPVVVDDCWHLYKEVEPSTVGECVVPEVEPSQLITTIECSELTCSPPGSDYTCWGERGWWIGEDDVVAICSPDFERLARPSVLPDCSSCGGGDQLPGSVTTRLGSVDVAIALGTDGGVNRQHASVLLRGDTLRPSLVSPAALDIVAGDNTHVVYDGSTLRQVLHGTVLADVTLEVGSVTQLVVRLYTGTNWTMVDGIYSPQGVPFQTVAFEYSSELYFDGDEELTEHHLDVHESGSVARTTRYIQRGDEWTMHDDWDEQQGAGRSTTKVSAWSGDTRTDRSQVLDSAGECIWDILELWTWTGTSRQLVSRIVDPDGEALSWTWSYYDDPTEQHRFGRLETSVSPSGHWVTYDYDTNDRLSKVVTQFLDGVEGDEANNRVVLYSYHTIDLADADAKDEQVTERVEYLLGQEIAREYTIDWSTQEAEAPYLSGLWTVRCSAPSAPVGSLATFLNTIAADPIGSSALVDVRIDPSSAVSLAWTSAGYATETHTFDILDGVVTTTRVGRVDELELPTLGRETVLLEAATGETLETKIYDWSTGTSQLVSYDRVDLRDELGRPLQITHVLEGKATTLAYGCCGPEMVTDRSGLQTAYTYDPVGRTETVTTAPGTAAEATMRYEYDALDRVIKEHRSSPTVAEHLHGERVYNTAGQLVTTKDARGVATAYTTMHLGAATLKATTFSDPDPLDGDPATPVAFALTYPDGSAMSLGGTAQADMTYVHGVAFDSNVGYHVEWKQEIVGGSVQGTEWTKSYSNAQDQLYRIQYPDGAELVRQYNGRGEVVKEMMPGVDAFDPVGVTTLYRRGSGYEAGLPGSPADWSGDWVLEVVDMGPNESAGNGLIDFAGWDRVTRHLHHVGERAGVLVQREIVSVWPDVGSDASVEYRAHEAQIDLAGGPYRSWVREWGAETAITRQVSNGSALETVDFPGAESGTVLYLSEYGRPTKEFWLDEGGGVRAQIEHQYDGLGRLWKETVVGNGQDVNSRETVYGYDVADRITQVTYPPAEPGGALPLSQVTSIEYDDLNRRTSVTTVDPNSYPQGWQKPSQAVFYEYYLDGGIKRVWGSETTTTAYQYDSAGRLSSMTTYRDAPLETGAATTTWAYDTQRGWLEQKSMPDGSYIAYDYEWSGRRRSQNDGRLITTSTEYSAAGELQSVAHSDGVTPQVVYAYDRLGRLHTVQDATGERTLVYSALGDVEEELFSAGSLFEAFRLDRSFNQSTRDREYLGLIRLATGVEEIGVVYDYGALGRLESVVAESSRAVYGYRPRTDELTTVSYEVADGQTWTPVTTRTIMYDDGGRTKEISWSSVGSAPDRAFGYSYDAWHNPYRVELETGQTWFYWYDELGQVTQARKQDLTRGWEVVPGHSFEYRYDNAGQPAHLGIGNRYDTYVGYWDDGQGDYHRHYSLFTADADGSNQYDQRTMPVAVDIIGYTSGQTVLINGGAPDATVQVGNQLMFYRDMTSEGWSNGTSAVYEEVEIVVDGVPEETRQVFVPQTPEVFEYDEAGNLTRDGHWRYVWDAENRLIEMCTRSELDDLDVPLLCIRYTYDYMSRRVKKHVYRIASALPQPAQTGLDAGASGVVEVEAQEDPVGNPVDVPVNFELIGTTKYIWDDWVLIAEVDGSDDLIRSYVWGLDVSETLQEEAGVGGLLFVRDHSSGSTHHALCDANGNVISMVDDSGDEGAWYDYGPFGEMLAAEGAFMLENPFRFSTKYADPETGLYYYGYRYYNPSTGRWLSRDPLGERAGENLYAFVVNAPTRYVDARGLCMQPTDICIDYLLRDGDWKNAKYLIAEKSKSYRKQYREIVRVLSAGVDVVDDIWKSLSFRIGSAFPYSKSGKCCEEGREFEWTALGTELLLGFDASAGIGRSFELAEFGGENVRLPCPIAGSYFEIEFGVEGKGKVLGAGVKGKMKAGMRWGPEGFGKDGRGWEAFGSFAVSPKFPLHFKAGLVQDKGSGVGRLINAVARLKLSIGTGWGFDLGRMAWYNVELEKTGRCCSE